MRASLMSYKIAIVDDHPVYREGLKIFFENHSLVKEVHAYAQGQNLINSLEHQSYELIFVDIMMPGMNGHEVACAVKSQKPGTRIIALTSVDDINMIDKMIQTGADGYLLKDVDYEEINSAFEKVMNGGNYFSHQIIVKLSNRLSKDYTTGAKVKLTKREEQILQFIAKGYSRKDIANELFISEKTVDKHRENLLLKTHTKNSVQLVIEAIKNKLIDM